MQRHLGGAPGHQTAALVLAPDGDGEALAGGVITQGERSAAGRRLTVAVWCENQRGRLVAAGTAELTLRSA